MKIRSGFVSNSSSSSFIVAYKMQDKCEHCGRSDSDLSDTFKKEDGKYYDETHLIAKGLKGITDKLREDYEDEAQSWESDTEDNSEEKKHAFVQFASQTASVSKWADKGYELMWVRVSYSDTEMFNSVLKTSGAEIIKDWDY